MAQFSIEECSDRFRPAAKTSVPAHRFKPVGAATPGTSEVMNFLKIVDETDASLG